MAVLLVVIVKLYKKNISISIIFVRIIFQECNWTYMYIKNDVH